MALDWSNERYVRLYTRITPDEETWCWQARLIWPHLIRGADRAGVIQAARGVRALVPVCGRAPLEIVEAGVAELLEDGCLVAIDGGYLVRNHVDANSATASGSRRQAEYKARARAKDALDGKRGNKEVTLGNEQSRAVTSGDAEVTPIRSDPSTAEPIRAEERETSPAAPALFPPDPPPLKPDPVAELWAHQERRRAGLPRTRPLALTTDRRRAIEARRKRDGFTDDDLHAAIDACADEAERTGDAQWFNGETNWVAKNITRALGRIGQATTRAGPMGTGNHSSIDATAQALRERGFAP